jgi:hypothetical protein
MVSTPNAPNGLFEKIEKEPEASCIYKRLKRAIVNKALEQSIIPLDISDNDGELYWEDHAGNSVLPLDKQR